MTEKNNGSRLLIGILSMLIALPTGLLVGMIGFRADKNMLLLYAVFLLSIGLAVILQTAVHEAGHMVFGLLTGFRFLSYRVLSLILSKEDGRLKLGRFSLPGTLGQCLMGVPADKDKKPYFLYNAGGVIFNLLSAMICYGIAFTSHNAFLAIFAAVNGMYDLILFVSNAIPFKGSGIANDGSNLLEMYRHPEAIDAFYKMLAINELMMKDGRMKDVPETWIDMSETMLHTGGLGAANAVWLENRLMDEHRFTEAEGLIQDILEKDYPLLEYHRNALLLDQKYLDCLNGRFEDVTDQKLLKFIDASGTSSVSIIRYLYVRALYRKDASEAEKYHNAFVSLEKGYPFRGEYQSEKEFMAIAKERLKADEGGMI